jgi:restriction endonuclease
MDNLFFDTEPQTWQELEELVCQAFIEMGYEIHRNKNITTVRGAAKIDVHATKKSTPIPTVTLVECKYWDKAVDQNVIYSFRSICADAGAHYGLIISKSGFQSGARESREFTNINLLNFREFQHTYFEEWRNSVFMQFAMMSDKLRAHVPFHDTDRILRAFKKYTMLYAGDGSYTEFFIKRGAFPVTMTDPRCDPSDLGQITISSPREYLEIGKQAIAGLQNYFPLSEP